MDTAGFAWMLHRVWMGIGIVVVVGALIDILLPLGKEK